MAFDDIGELGERYELELGRIIDTIRRQASGVRCRDGFRVLLQLPDGLKPYGLAICDEIGKRLMADGLDVDVRIWLGDCFGACDLPDSDADLVVQFGHAVWK